MQTYMFLWNTPEPDVPAKAQIPDEALNQVRHLPIPKDPVEKETEVPEPLHLPIVPPPPKAMVLEQPLSHVLPMSRQMQLLDTLPKSPN